MKQLTPMMAIKKKCKEHCCCGDLTSWKECSVKTCPLWAYRMGKRPQKQGDSSSNSEEKKESKQNVGGGLK
jgi:hypothetical protein